jgi:hypothetical protein
MTGVSTSPNSRRRPRVAVAQGEVQVGLVELDHAVGRRHADVEVGVVALEGLHLRQQPQRRERREGVEVHDAAPARLPDLPHACVEPVEPGRDHPQQRAAVAGELDVAGAAGEQRCPEFLFQALDLPADRRLGQVQLVGRVAEAEPARHGLEGPQAAQR